jgi:hypothetical protein
LAAEKLAEHHGCSVSRETLRGRMIAEGLWQDRRHRLSSPHQPRRRRDCLGELVQIDGSEHGGGAFFLNSENTGRTAAASTGSSHHPRKPAACTARRGARTSVGIIVRAGFSRDFDEILPIERERFIVAEPGWPRK